MKWTNTTPKPPLKTINLQHFYSSEKSHTVLEDCPTTTHSNYKKTTLFCSNFGLFQESHSNCRSSSKVWTMNTLLVFFPKFHGKFHSFYLPLTLFCNLSVKVLFFTSFFMWVYGFDFWVFVFVLKGKSLCFGI
jgi:hypothetical protein